MMEVRNGRVDVAGLRRTQIVEAAVAVITEQGLQNLSLSEIEKKASMSRGQLTYYFPTKEDILLAVFDYLVMLIHARIGTPHGKPCDHEDVQSAWAWIEHLLTAMLIQPPVSPEFSCLQYTFLSQIAHREDFRERLAMLYERWRQGMGMGLEADQKRDRRLCPAPPRIMASLVQAILHGLSMQLAADPKAFNREEMLAICLDMLGNYLGRVPPARKKRKRAAKKIAAADVTDTRVSAREKGERLPDRLRGRPT
jgi:AcrR family transcriptional regulator